MANLTITVDAEVLRRARLRALERGTSVNRVLREYLDVYAGEGPWADATRALLESSRRSRSGRGGSRWSRDDLHDR